MSFLNNCYVEDKRSWILGAWDTLELPKDESWNTGSTEKLDLTDEDDIVAGENDAFPKPTEGPATTRSIRTVHTEAEETYSR